MLHFHRECEVDIIIGVPWIHVHLLALSDPWGLGAVRYSVYSNPGPPREGWIKIATAVFKVKQAGSFIAPDATARRRSRTARPR